MLTLAEIALVQREWSERNFPGNTPLEPLEGLIEELGELAHARLKRRQGIRHTPEECVAMERDAIGDMGIYLCDFAGRIGRTLAIDDVETLMGRSYPNQTDAVAFALLARTVGCLAFWYHDSGSGRYGVSWDWKSAAVEVAERLAVYSHLRGWDFLEILNETWAKVSRRDWRANPATAGDVA